MAYNAGVENFLVSYDHSFYDELNETKDSWSLVEEFTLTPMKVEVFETNTTPPQFPRSHNWLPNFKEMVGAHN